MTTDIRHGYKILTADWRSPIRGNDAPLCDGTLPCVLPTVPLDTGPEECSTGWHYTAVLADAVRIAGWWGDGRPAKALHVRGSKDAIARGAKRRASGLTLLRRCSDAEIRAAMRAVVTPWAGTHADVLADEQWAWYVALGRPQRDAAIVEAGLTTALAARQLSWTLRQFQTAGDARAAVDAWATRDAWAAWAAWDAWAARDARGAWGVWAARAARDGLIFWTAVRLDWITGYASNQWTVGLRDAYAAGLGLAAPIGPTELGWAMDSPDA